MTLLQMDTIECDIFRVDMLDCDMGTPMLVRMLVTKNHLVTTKPLGEKKVQLVRPKFSWREKSAVGETKNQLARKKFSW